MWPLPGSPLTRRLLAPPLQGATAIIETTTITTPEGYGWFFGILALIVGLGAASAHSSYSATTALLSSQRYDSPWPTPPLASVATPFAPASLNGFCEVGDTSSFADIASLDSVPANHPVRLDPLASIRAAPARD